MRRIPDHYYKAAELHAEIPLLRYISPTVFQLKNGSVGIVLEVTGIDPDCRLDEDLERYCRRIEKAAKAFDERFRLKQYFSKRFAAPIRYKAEYPTKAATQFLHRRAHDLEARSDTLASASIHFVVLFEGDGTGAKIRQLLGLSQAKAEQELTAATYRKVDTLLNTVRAFTASLDDMLGLEILDETSGKLFFRALLNPDPIQAIYFHDESGDRLDYAIPDTDIEVHRDHLWMNSYHLMAATVKATPLKPRPAEIATALSRVNCDFIACMEWKPQTAMHMRKIIKSRKRVFNGQQVNMLMSALMDTPPEGRTRKEDLEYHEDRLGQSLVRIEEGFQFGAFSCVIILLGQDYQRVRDSYADLVRVYGQSDASLVKESLNLLSAYLSIVPGNTDRNHSYNYLLNRDFANLAFCWQSWTGNQVNRHLSDEYLCTYETTDQQVYYFNGHVGGTFGLLKSGAPESGKSFDTVYQLASLQKYEPVTVILDIGHSYRELTHYFGGQYFEISKRDQRTRMNPLALEDTHENRSFLFSFLRLLVGRDPNLSPEDAAREDTAIVDGIASVYALPAHLRRLKNLSVPARLKLRLGRWIEGGQYGHIFDNDTDTIRFTHFQTFEFQGMEKTPDLLVPVCFYVTQRFDQVLYAPDQLDRLKVLAIDEAWRWMLSGDMGPYMIDKLKTGRKNNLCNLFITQSGLDAERAGFGELLNEACPTKIFFANPEIRPETYQKLYRLNVKQAERIAELKPREELAIYATDPERPAVKQFNVVRLRIDNAEDRLLCSNDPKANQIKSQRHMATA